LNFSIVRKSFFVSDLSKIPAEKRSPKKSAFLKQGLPLTVEAMTVAD